MVGVVQIHVPLHPYCKQVELVYCNQVELVYCKQVQLQKCSGPAESGLAWWAWFGWVDVVRLGGRGLAGWAWF